MNNQPFIGMPDFINRTPLTEDETRQLQDLLIRYLAYHAAGLVNLAIDGLIAKFGKAKVIEHIPEEPAHLIEHSPQSRRGSARKKH